MDVPDPRDHQGGGQGGGSPDQEPKPGVRQGQGGWQRHEQPRHPEPRGPQRQPSHGEPLAIDFTTLVMSFASAAMISMGRVPEPATGTIHRDLATAQQNIDILTLLQEKTRGNLNADEERLMDQILYELRMSFVEAMKEGQ
ncbi:MAG TPA: DUF1844 domain-containing protein [Deltaproteobacteria bacterium]|nr:DUF1844 domain-containing protein [Deltaproteobacteria bacterium]